MVELKLTDEQALQVMIACEFFARVRCGQFQEIANHTLDIKENINECIARQKNSSASINIIGSTCIQQAITT